ncbi:MAG TPA: hypothetical protein VMU21_10110, partial [Thermodesulfovibrionales bacterium]|nr:hypothetical protein [Thermodesulfovibrionales bacterium]
KEEIVFPLESPVEPLPDVEEIEAPAIETHTHEEETVVEPQAISHEEFEKLEDSLSVETPETMPGIDEPIEIPEDQAIDLLEGEAFDDILAEPVEVPQEHPDLSAPRMGEEAKPAGSGADIGAADSMVASGNFFKALEIYREVLSRNPDDKQTLQRILELKTLMKLMGRGDEVVIAKLETFLDGVRRNFGKSQ